MTELKTMLVAHYNDFIAKNIRKDTQQERLNYIESMDFTDKDVIIGLFNSALTNKVGIEKNLATVKDQRKTYAEKLAKANREKEIETTILDSFNPWAIKNNVELSELEYKPRSGNLLFTAKRVDFQTINAYLDSQGFELMNFTNLDNPNVRRYKFTVIDSE